MIQEMNFYIGKIQLERELWIKRSQRLEGPDDFLKAKVYKRPSTKAKVGGSLYVENLHPPPISNIRQDDIEVFLRRQTYLNKWLRVFYKFIDKLKWIPMLERFEILEESILYAKQQRDQSFLQQNDHVDELLELAKKDLRRKKATENDLDEVKNTYYCITYKDKVLNKADEIRCAMKYDHERLPNFISNTLELITDILQRSDEYGVHGNIDLDQGYSFLYQIAIFFPMHFQKQVIKTTFKPYDANVAPDEYSANLERVADFQGKGEEKVPVKNMIRGVKEDNDKEGEGEGDERIGKAPMLTPLDSVSDLKMNSEYKNIVSLQMKVSDWLNLAYKLTPRIKPHMKKQAAFLNTNNPIDKLLKFSYDMTWGVQDISIINAIVEDVSKKHQFCVDGSLKLFNKARDFEEIKYKDTTDLYTHFMDALENNLKLNYPDANNVIKMNKRLSKKGGNMFFQLPQHLVHSLYMLRHLKIRDFKIKILYTLNYYRSVQRRLAFDLNEMNTRDTVLGDQEFKPPSEATRISAKNMTDNASIGVAGNSKKQQLAKAKAALEEAEVPRETNESALSHINNIYMKAKEDHNTVDNSVEEHLHPLDRNKYRYKEKLRHKFISTCPVMSRYHTSFGYTMSRFSRGEEWEYEYENRDQMDKTAKRFMGRADHIEFAENNEILIKDDFGIHIMYDCVESDLEMVANELLLTGSYFIKRQEPLFDSEDIDNLHPVIDRISTLEMLMKYESEYQYRKAKLIKLYMETYEHIVDPLEQQRFIQFITDVMAERPRINIDSNSFEDSYKLEIEILDKKIDLIKSVICFQIANESRENEKIADYLEKAHQMINDSIDKKWAAFKPEHVNAELKNRGIHRRTDEVRTKEPSEPKDNNTDYLTKQTDGMHTSRRPSQIDTSRVTQDSPTRAKSPTKQEMEQLFKAKRRGLIGLEEEPEDRFSEALGLPKISQEDIYK